jgi:hypothetical protein
MILQWICKLTVSLFNYFELTNFFWMLVEGVYILSRLSQLSAVAISRDYPIARYVLLGWGKFL